MEINISLWVIPAIIILFFFLIGIRIVRPTHRALIERLGKYNRFANSGFHWIMPMIDRMFQVNITEQMIDADPQEIITNDNLMQLLMRKFIIELKMMKSVLKIHNTMLIILIFKL